MKKMNTPEALFIVKIITPSEGDFIYYVEEYAGFPEKAIERAIKEYQLEEYDDFPFWQEITIRLAEGKLIKKDKLKI
jgi:hypothetical protein